MEAFRASVGIAVYFSPPSRPHSDMTRRCRSAGRLQISGEVSPMTSVIETDGADFCRRAILAAGWMMPCADDGGKTAFFSPVVCRGHDDFATFASQESSAARYRLSFQFLSQKGERLPSSGASVNVSNSWRFFLAFREAGARRRPCRTVALTLGDGFAPSFTAIS